MNIKNPIVLKKENGELAIAKKYDKKEMKKMNAMKKMKEGKYHATKPGSLEEAVMSALSHPHIKG